ncbi:hypothetical protein BDZ97DRAFT_1009766 [Flammula alnicola]|nr:hypothetical protein BDZ97DRAFT_67854 [Flammula alnicola]KAF8972058.1 hypothetical protein BDZ97DRAFT_1009766 [Flammula alnicola]
MLSTINPSKFVVESDGVLGAVEVSTFLSLILYGVSLSQGYTYFRRSQEDRLALKALVSLLLFLETCHSFTAAMAVYYDTVTRWQSAEANSYPISTNVMVETLVTLVVQCFFTFRIYRLSDSLLITIACLFLVLLRFIGGVVLVVELYLDVPNHPNGLSMVVQFSWLITSSLAVGGAADVLIAIFMTYYLRKFDSPTNLKSTTDIINRLVRWSLKTGLITSMTSVAVIICFQAMQNMVWFGLYIILAKLYSNSLLVSLNARPQKSGGLSAEKTLDTLQFEQFQEPISISFQLARRGNSFEWRPALPSKSQET